MNPLTSISATNIHDGWDDGRRAPSIGETMAWPDASAALGEAPTWWVTTTGDAGPHTRPVLGVVVDDRPHVACAPTSVKARLMSERPSVSLAASAKGMDVVVRGTARRLVAADELAAVATAYEDNYGWPVTVEGEALTAPYGAATAGAPPYVVFRIEPATVHAFGTDDEHGPRSTRWTFEG